MNKTYKLKTYKGSESQEFITENMYEFLDWIEYTKKNYDLNDYRISGSSSKGLLEVWVSR
jgi:hypothetical protein